MRLALGWLLATTILVAQRPSDSVTSAAGALTITPIAHGTVYISSGTEVVLVDPTVYGGWDGPHPGGVAPQISYAGRPAPTLIVITDSQCRSTTASTTVDSIVALRNE